LKINLEDSIMNRLFQTLILSTILISTHAYALPRIALFWSGMTTIPMGTVGTYTGNTGPIGGGASVRFGGSRFGVTLGGIVQSRTLGASASHIFGSLPVMLQVRLLKVGFAQAGGYFDYVFSGTVPLIAGAAMNRVDYGLKGGLGVEIPVGPINLLVAAHYKYGLASLSTVASTPYSLGGIEYMAGISFGGKQGATAAKGK
jgi:hypothetical protein